MGLTIFHRIFPEISHIVAYIFNLNMRNIKNKFCELLSIPHNIVMVLTNVTTTILFILEAPLGQSVFSTCRDPTVGGQGIRAVWVPPYTWRGPTAYSHWRRRPRGGRATAPAVPHLRASTCHEIQVAAKIA